MYHQSEVVRLCVLCDHVRNLQTFVDIINSQSTVRFVVN